MVKKQKRQGPPKPIPKPPEEDKETRAQRRNKLFRVIQTDIKDRERARKKLGPIKAVRYVDKARDMATVLRTRDLRKDIMSHRGRLKDSMLADEADNPGFLLLLEQAEKETRGGRPEIALVYLDKAVAVHPEDTHVRVLRGRCRVKGGQYEEALADARAVLVDFRQPSCAGALIVQAEAFYALGDFENALVSQHRAARQQGLLKTEREDIETGIRRSEEAIGNCLGESAGVFFKHIAQTQLWKKVLERAPVGFMAVSWIQLKTLVNSQGGVSLTPAARREDRKLLMEMAGDKIFLEDLVVRMSQLQGGGGVAEEADTALDFLKERKEFWGQLKPDFEDALAPKKILSRENSSRAGQPTSLGQKPIPGGKRVVKIII